MTLVFIFLAFIIILALFILIILLSTLKIKIENFNIINFKNNKEYKMFIQLYFLDKIKIFSNKIDSKKIKKISNSKRFKNIKYNELKQKLPPKKEILKAVKILNLQIEKFKLIAEISLDDAPLTSYIVAVISSLISIILSKTAKNNNKIYYNIKPIYNNKTLNISFESILNIKIVHIIYMLIYMVKKGGSKYGRTSNRRAYGYSHELN